MNCCADVAEQRVDKRVHTREQTDLVLLWIHSTACRDAVTFDELLMEERNAAMDGIQML